MWDPRLLKFYTSKAAKSLPPQMLLLPSTMTRAWTSVPCANTLLQGINYWISLNVRLWQYPYACTAYKQTLLAHAVSCSEGYLWIATGGGPYSKRRYALPCTYVVKLVILLQMMLMVHCHLLVSCFGRHSISALLRSQMQPDAAVPAACCRQCHCPWCLYRCCFNAYCPKQRAGKTFHKCAVASQARCLTGQLS